MGPARGIAQGRDGLTRCCHKPHYRILGALPGATPAWHRVCCGGEQPGIRGTDSERVAVLGTGSKPPALPPNLTHPNDAHNGARGQTQEMHFLLVTRTVMKKRLTRLVCAGGIVFVSTTANAELIDIGGGMIYDSGQDLTWMQNADVNGPMTWFQAMDWAENLVYGGYDDWRLPSTLGGDDPSCLEDARGDLFFESHVGCTGGEFEKLTEFELYDAEDPPSLDSYSHRGNFLLNEPFENVQLDSRYWTATPYRADEGGIDPCIYDDSCIIVDDTGMRTDFYWQWSFTRSWSQSGYLLNGPYKTTLGGGNSRYAWAVRSGGPAIVPVPPSIWLVGSGVVGLIGISRRRDKSVLDEPSQ